jgi:hypothetical protein
VTPHVTGLVRFHRLQLTESREIVYGLKMMGESPTQAAGRWMPLVLALVAVLLFAASFLAGPG